MSFVCEFAEANSARSKVTHVAVGTSAQLAASHDTRLELRRTSRLDDQ